MAYMDQNIQTSIIRQTCLKASVEMMKGSLDKVDELNLKDIIWLASKFEQYVVHGKIMTAERQKELDKLVADAIAKGVVDKKPMEEQQK